MDVGLYREDEQFSFPSSSYMESYSSDSASFTIEQNELFEDLRPTPQPPNDIFEWHSDDMERELNSDTDLIDQSIVCKDEEEMLHDPTATKEELQKILGLQNWQPVWQPMIKSRMDHLPAHYAPEGDTQVTNNKNAANLQEILELPEIANSLTTPHLNLANIKVEDNGTSRIAVGLPVRSENALNETSSHRTESESSDLLNASFSSTELTNFDIAEYVFEENKQTKKSIEIPEIKIENVQVKKEENAHSRQVVKGDASKRTVKAGMKKIDLKARKYIIDRDTKKSISEDEGDIDIETVSEEESSPILEAGDLTDLLEQFEATEVKSNESITNNNKHLNISQQNVSLNVKVEIKAEDENKNKVMKPVVKVKVEQDGEDKSIKATRPIKIKQEKIDISYNIQAKIGTNLSQTPQTCQQKSEEQFYLNKIKVNSGPIVKIQETTTSSRTPSATSNRQILDSLPQELINRIKESGKRKPITVIQAIPNNRKRSKIQEPIKTLPPVSSDSVYLDHNYCSNSTSPSSQISKKDSGFVSSEEDDRAVISRQPTVKNADGTLMVSLLKANTIRQLDSMTNQKKKLNFEEYKKRRNGLLTPKNISQNCSPNTSTCSSPIPEDEHQKMLKHQEKLRKMAQEVLNAAPKSEKKAERQFPVLIPLSPASSNKSLSQPGSPALARDLSVKVENPVKVELGDNEIEPVKVEAPVKPDIDNGLPMQIDPPKVPANLERKVLVSFGVNTDFKIAKNEDPLAPVEKLQEIKPLLEKASNKITENSLIASVIENIPKVLDKNEKPDNVNAAVQGESYEHGEYKEVIYLEKDRVRCKTKDAETQTNVSLIEQTKRGRIRRRLSSSSSCSSYKSKNSASRRSRKSSDSSSSSRSSDTSRSSISSSRSSEYSSRNSSRLSYSRSRSRSPKRRRNGSADREHLNAVEERRIIYVGKIVTGTTKEDLRKKFQKFGVISKISLHFRDIGENYGFVTFKYKEDAHAAYEHGNDDAAFPFYKISFGGRREFCKTAYSDLDNMRDDMYYQAQTSGDSYDKLLKEALEKLKKRKA